MVNNFKVLSGDIDAAINIIKEVTNWGRSVGLKVGKMKTLQKKS